MVDTSLGVGGGGVQHMFPSDICPKPALSTGSQLAPSLTEQLLEKESGRVNYAKSTHSSSYEFDDADIAIVPAVAAAAASTNSTDNNSGGNTTSKKATATTKENTGPRAASARLEAEVAEVVARTG